METIRRFLFLFASGLLLLIAAVNLYIFRAEFAVLMRRAGAGSDAELSRWQRWAHHHDRLFAMLQPAERIGILVGGARNAGVLLVRRPKGVSAEHRLLLSREKPGVILSFDSTTAARFLDSVPREEPEAIWQKMKDALYSRHITVWVDEDAKRLRRGGYLAFLRAIDTRPPRMDWLAVKQALGEQSAPAGK